MKERAIDSIVDAVETIEGGGFPVRRPFPAPELQQVDPFLLLDEMGPVDWEPGKAIGAPDHPHRGFETVTYMLEGKMQHKDSAGASGVIGPGDVQWMTAGVGVVHSEMPEKEFRRTGGHSHGFQLWVNLLARDKMIAPRYQELPKDKIPEATSEDGLVGVRVIAGEALGKTAAIETRTPIMYLHYTIKPGGSTTPEIPEDHQAMAYVFSGQVVTGRDKRKIAAGKLAVFGPGSSIRLSVPADQDAAAQILLLTGVPLREPMVRYGPFVMNTKEEIHKAIADYQAGRMGKIAS
ncbi:MAG: pirin family protein [Planctomycetota bacterium]|nr:pirin family protein [Planctomycetota bacterium]